MTARRASDPGADTELMNSARAKREQAKRCREVINDVDLYGPAARLLAEYAMELEERAEMLDRLASDRQTAGRAGEKPEEF